MKDAFNPPQVDLRPPELVMRLSRMGQAFPTRLSFLRILMRNLRRQEARPECTRWNIDADGHGEAVYTLELDGQPISLVAISRALDDDARSDRVIADAWDAAFVLYDGEPSAAEVARIAAQAPLQEGGRFEPTDLVLSRANKSMRVWTHIVEALKSGTAPDKSLLGDVGYLMRTTAVYGNGKFGIADRHLYDTRPTLSGPFAAEMLCVWLIRQFTLDLAEHVGCGKIPLDMKRGLGVGNATGLGMAPFLVSHPVLLHNWMMVRETALARVRALGPLSRDDKARLMALQASAAEHLAAWQVPDTGAANDLRELRTDWAKLGAALAGCETAEAVYAASQAFGIGTQELVVSLLIELCPDLVDGLSDCLGDPLGPDPAPLADTGVLAEAIAADWGWALKDYSCPETVRRFWYISENKLEPRIGDRFDEPGAESERPLYVARAVAALRDDLPDAPEMTTAFLARHPEHAFAIKRVSTLARQSYAEIRDNLIAAECRPIDMLRCKLAFFGATRFDPKSDLWTRITLAQGAPLIHEVAEMEMPWLPESLT